MAGTASTSTASTDAGAGRRGRREANKRATRTALSQAADRLFTERGYEATTVAQIARDAGVGERTFYRYFGSKEDLLAGRALAWIDRLHEAIRARPADEGPYQALAHAMSAVTAELARAEPGYEAWILAAPRPLAPLRRVEPRPMRRLEASVTEAILARIDAAPPGGVPAERTPAAEFDAQLLARVAVAALRTAIVHRRTHPGRDGTGIERLLGDAFTRLSALAGPG